MASHQELHHDTGQTRRVMNAKEPLQLIPSLRRDWSRAENILMPPFATRCGCIHHRKGGTWGISPKMVPLVSESIGPQPLSAALPAE